jgi:hypothetical protein
MQCAGALGSLGGVLGDVPSHGGGGDRFTGGEDVDRTDVQLLAEAEVVPSRLAGTRSSDVDLGGRVLDGGLQRVEGGPVGWLGGGSVGSVEAEYGVEVDQSASLVFGDFGVGESEGLGEAAAGYLAEVGEFAADLHGEAVPELSGVGLPQDRAAVVVAVGAQRFAEARVLRLVAFVAGQGPTVRAGAACAPGSAAQLGAVVLVAGVDGAEAGGGEGGEDPGVRGDAVGGVFSADQSGADELEGVAAVELGAGGADGGAPVAARDQEGGVVAGVGVQDLAAGGVYGVGGSDQVDRVGAAAEADDALLPRREVGAGGVADQVSDRLGRGRLVVATRGGHAGRTPITHLGVGGGSRRGRVWRLVAPPGTRHGARHGCTESS